jgi:hypothetical protein
MKLSTKILAGAATAAGLTLALAAPASAYIACNREGDCWHTDRRVTAPGVTFSFHPDDWYFHRDWDHDKDMRWRSERHEGRGYWRNGVWITL